MMTKQIDLIPFSDISLSAYYDSMLLVFGIFDSMADIMILSFMVTLTTANFFLGFLGVSLSLAFGAYKIGIWSQTYDALFPEPMEVAAKEVASCRR